MRLRDFRITPTSEVPTDGARTLASPFASTGDVRVTSVSGSRSIGRASRSSETSDPLDPGVVPRLRVSRFSRRSNLTSSRVTLPLTRAFFSSVSSRSAAAAASLAVVASAGIVAVHPNGASLVAVPARLGQATAEAAPAVSASTPAATAAAVEAAVAAPVVAAPTETAPAATVPAATVPAAKPVDESAVAAGVVEPFQNLVTKTHTTSAAVVEAGAYIDNEGVKEELAANVRALNLASDRLAAAEAEANKADQDVQQKEIEEQNAQIDVRTAAAEAAAGSQAEALEDTAKLETAGLAENKRSYLLTRGEYEASTALVATRKAELASAAKATEEARKKYAAAKKLADDAKTEADAMAKAAKEHLEATKNAAVVGEETFQEGVQRSQQMAQITAAATSQEIKAGDLAVAAADAQKKLDDATLFQKTAQETLDAETARNAELKKASNAEQKTFIDASDVAAKDATAAADAGKKAKDALDAAHVRLANAADALAKSRERRDRLKKDILATRRAEYDAQFQKTEAVRAKANVVDAVSKSTSAASAVENVKQNNVRDAKVATVVTKFDEAATTMAADKLAAERSAGIQAANAISAQAAGMTLPATLEETIAVPVVNTSPAVTAAATEKPAATAAEAEKNTEAPAATTAEAETTSTEVAATGSGKPDAVALSQAKAQAQAKAKEEEAIQARMAVIKAQMAARKQAENAA